MARRRRGRGEGAIFQRGDGLWTASLSLGYDENGRRRRRVVYGATKQEVQEKLRQLHGEAVNGIVDTPQRQKVSDFLNRWLEDTARPTIRRNTHASYEGVIRLHINK